MIAGLFELWITGDYQGMTTAIFDREDERNKISHFCAPPPAKEVRLLWIEGRQGVGKTVMLAHALDLLQPSEAVFAYMDGRRYHKCHESDQEKPFAMVGALLATLEARHRRRFASIVSGYMSRYSDVTLRESLFLALPGVPGLEWLAPLLKKEQERRAQVQASISQHVLEHHLAQLAIDSLSRLLPKCACDETLVLAIDDVHWIDKTSFDIVCAAIAALQKQHVFVSLVVTSRDYHSVRNAAWLSEVERRLGGLASTVEQVLIDNLSRPHTVEYLRFRSRPDLEQHVGFIFDHSNGNPQELFQLTKLSVSRVEELCQDDPSTTDREEDEQLGLFNRERIAEVMTSRFEYLVTLCAVSALQNDVYLEELDYLVPSVARRLRGVILTVDEMRDIVMELEVGHSILQRAGGFVVCHDSLVPLIALTARRLGEFEEIWGALSDALEDTAAMPIGFDTARYIAKSLWIARAYDPKHALRILSKYYPMFRDREGVSSAFAVAASECILGCSCDALDDRLLNAVAVDALCRLTSSSRYDQALRLADHLLAAATRMTRSTAFDYYRAYIVAMAQRNVLERTSPASFEEIAKQLNLTTRRSDYRAVLAGLTRCSALEYLGRFEEIRVIYADLEARTLTIADPHEKRHARALLCKNAGLARDHHLAIMSYEEAVHCASELSGVSVIEYRTVLGTAQNNLGLGYVYGCHLDEAERSFENAIETLHGTEYGTDCPFNNLAVCSILNGHYQQAVDYIERARMTFGGSPYQDVSIDINLGLALWKLGHQEDALRLVGPIADSSDTRSLVTATIVRARAAMTYAYFLMEQGRYWDAGRYYHESRLQYFRLYNEREQHRRSALAEYCLARARESVPSDIGDLSVLMEPSTDILERPYDLMLLALYVD